VFHQNIVLIKDLFVTDTQYIIVLELLNGGEVFDQIVKLGCFTEQKAAKYIREVLVGLRALHDCGFVHRDLKPDNLLLSSPQDDAHVKITDFGLAKRTNGQSLYDACGTIMYLAPEMIINSRAGMNYERQDGYDNKVDIWATGVILFIMLCGFPPFYDEDQTQMLDDIIKLEVGFPSPEWDEISDKTKNFVKRLLEKDPEKRPSAEQAIKDAWIKENVNIPEKPRSISQLKPARPPLKRAPRLHPKILWDRLL